VSDVKFLTVRDLRNATKGLWEDLANNENVIITSNGKPKSLMIGINESNFEETLRAWNQVKTWMAVNKLREEASKRPPISEAEIEEEIALCRREAREGSLS
jgi:antitoxin (DNA-binding transcriptional repressor) of toxin-antitoxin stability system